MRQVRPSIDLGHRLHEVGFRQVAEQQHVEEPVVRAGFRDHQHPAAEIAAVCDDHLVHQTDALLPVDGDSYLGVLPARENGERRPEVRDLAAECLRRLIRPLCDRAAHPHAGDVEEPGLAGLTRPGAIPDPSGIDRPRLPAKRDLDRILELGRDRVGADEVDAGAARDHRQLGSAADDAGGDLVDRAVAADCDDELCVLRRLGGEFPQVFGLLGEEGVTLEAE
jgi:hypothetical protein